MPTAAHSTKSDHLDFESGMDQQFCLLTHRICPSKLMSTETALDEKGRWTWPNIPAVIQIKTRLGQNEQIHLTYCTFEKNNQGTIAIKFTDKSNSISIFSREN